MGAFGTKHSDEANKAKSERMRGRDVHGNIIISDTQKLCGSCNKWKDFSEYHKNGASSHGYMSYCKDCERIRKRIARYNNIKEYKYREYQRDAILKDREFNLTQEYFTAVIDSPCIYCGSHDEVNGIDRIDSNRGYTEDNSVPCCAMCNKMKLNHTVDAFMYQCRRIVDYNILISEN